MLVEDSSNGYCFSRSYTVIFAVTIIYLDLGNNTASSPV